MYRREVKHIKYCKKYIKIQTEELDYTFDNINKHLFSVNCLQSQKSALIYIKVFLLGVVELDWFQIHFLFFFWFNYVLVNTFQYFRNLIWVLKSLNYFFCRPFLGWLGEVYCPFKSSSITSDVPLSLVQLRLMSL